MKVIYIDNTPYIFLTEREREKIYHALYDSNGKGLDRDIKKIIKENWYDYKILSKTLGKFISLLVQIEGEGK